jgi:hypothetical protein
MKTNIKLLVGLPLVICLAIAFFLEIAQEYRKEGVVSTTGSEATPSSGRVPAFSIITIRGRAFTAQKPETTETEKEIVHTSSQTDNQQSGILPLAYHIINRSFVWGK